MELKYNLRNQDTSPDYPSSSRQNYRRTTSSPTEAPAVLEPKSENEEPLDDSNNTNKKASDAMIALQQLASISTARSLQHLVQNMSNIDTSNLFPGRKPPRQGSLRSPTYESNRCPLCARAYRSQASLNEHMRKEHSVLI